MNWTTIINEFDPQSRQWTPTNNPLPNRFNAAGICELPFGPGRKFTQSGALSHNVGNWRSR